MLYNKGNHAKFKCVQPQPSPLQDENGGKIHQTWNFGYNKLMSNFKQNDELHLTMEAF